MTEDQVTRRTFLTAAATTTAAFLPGDARGSVLVRRCEGEALAFAGGYLLRCMKRRRGRINVQADYEGAGECPTRRLDSA